MGIEPKTACPPFVYVSTENMGGFYSIHVMARGSYGRYEAVYESIEEVSAFMLGVYEEASKHRRSFNYSGPTLIAADRIRALIRTKKQKC